MTRKTQKKLRKLLTLVSCAVLLVCVTIVGTVAYLTSTPAAVVNTFTVGKLNITLDETDVDVNGVKDSDSRVIANAYHLVPDHQYTKDPTVHFAAGNDKSYVFVKVENGIATIESDAEGYTKIADQITTTNGWTALTGVNNVFYKVVEANTGADAVDLPVFANFKVDAQAILTDANGNNLFANNPITITAYAIQFDGFANAEAAWTAGNFQ